MFVLAITHLRKLCVPYDSSAHLTRQVLCEFEPVLALDHVQSVSVHCSSDRAMGPVRVLACAVCRSGAEAWAVGVGDGTGAAIADCVFDLLAERSVAAGL